MRAEMFADFAVFAALLTQAQCWDRKYRTYLLKACIYRVPFKLKTNICANTSAKKISYMRAKYINK